MPNSMRTLSLKLLACGTLVAALALSRPATAESAALPAKNQALLLLRILAYDRALAERAGEGVTVAVVGREDGSESQKLRDAILAAIREVAANTSVAGLKVRVVSIPYTTPDKLDAALGAEKASAAYVSSAMGDALDAILPITRKRRVLTFGPSADYVTSGISLGIVRREAKAAILVNLPSAKSEGANLDAALLRVAEVMKK